MPDDKTAPAKLAQPPEESEAPEAPVAFTDGPSAKAAGSEDKAPGAVAMTLNPRLAQFVHGHVHNDVSGDLTFAHGRTTWVPGNLLPDVTAHRNNMFNPPLQTVVPV